MLSVLTAIGLILRRRALRGLDERVVSEERLDSLDNDVPGEFVGLVNVSLIVSLAGRWSNLRFTDEVSEPKYVEEVSALVLELVVVEEFWDVDSEDVSSRSSSVSWLRSGSDGGGLLGVADFIFCLGHVNEREFFCVENKKIMRDEKKSGMMTFLLVLKSVTNPNVYLEEKKGRDPALVGRGTGSPPLGGRGGH